MKIGIKEELIYPKNNNLAKGKNHGKRNKKKNNLKVSPFSRVEY